MRHDSFNRQLFLAALFLIGAGGAWAASYSDNFSGGINVGANVDDWTTGSGWSVVSPSAGIYALQGDGSSGETYVWRGNWPLQTTFTWDMDLAFQSLYANSQTMGTASLGLSSLIGPGMLVDVDYSAPNSVLIQAAYYHNNTWTTVLRSGWISGAQTNAHFKITRENGGTTLTITLTCPNGFNRSFTTSPIDPVYLNTLKNPGLRAVSAIVDFANLSLTTSLPALAQPASHYHALTDGAIGNLLTHFWTGSTTSGHIVNTWGGYALPHGRGANWERATMFFALDDYYLASGDDTIRQRLAADWNRTRAAFAPWELEAVGADSPANWASDDAGWGTMMYIRAYRLTGDPFILERAKGIVTNAFNRWEDDQLGGGMWYSDARQAKSDYEVGIVLSAFQIYEYTNDPYFYDQAKICYDWMESYLLRPDGLYWCGYDPTGPDGASFPNDIGEAGSVSFLAGNMAMGVLHAEMYKLTGDDTYRQRAIRTVNALPAKEVDTSGAYLNDRDGWTEGTFAGYWARNVLTLPGIDPAHWDTMKRTADAIVNNDKTTDSYYGASWDGPLGPDSPWWNAPANSPTRPQQIMTSANAVAMIVAAASLPDTLQPSPTPTATPTPLPTIAPRLLQVSKAGGSGVYTKITDAVADAYNGDTIEIQDSGTYSDGRIGTGLDNLTVRAAAGQTPLLDGGTTDAGVDYDGVTTLTIQGLNINAAWPVEARQGGASLVFCNCYIANTDTTAHTISFDGTTGNLTLNQCLLLSMNGDYVYSTPSSGGMVQISNSTIVGNETSWRLFDMTNANPGSFVIDSIIANLNPSSGNWCLSVSGNVTVSHCDIFNASTTHPDATLWPVNSGTSVISIDPQFQNMAAPYSDQSFTVPAANHCATVGSNGGMIGWIPATFLVIHTPTPTPTPTPKPKSGVARWTSYK